jgi:hypothetical protein
VCLVYSEAHTTRQTALNCRDHFLGLARLFEAEIGSVAVHGLQGRKRHSWEAEFRQSI